MSIESRSRKEQETSITFSECPDDPAIIWTCSPVMLRKFAKLGLEPFRVDSPTSKAFKVPKSFIAIRPKAKRNLSDEARKVLSDRMKGLTRKSEA